MCRASTAHHQEVRGMYLANGTSKMNVSERGWSGKTLGPVAVFTNLGLYEKWKFNYVKFI
jgi:hypothetical protein